MATLREELHDTVATNIMRYVRKILAPIKIKSALPPPKKKVRNFAGIVFPAERPHFFQAPIKLAQPFQGPRIADRNFHGHEDFSEYEKYRCSGPRSREVRGTKQFCR